MKTILHRRTLTLILCMGILLIASSTAYSQSDKQKQEAIRAKLQLEDCMTHSEIICKDLNTANLKLSKEGQRKRRWRTAFLVVLIEEIIRNGVQLIK